MDSVGKDLLSPESTPSKTDSSDVASRNLTPIETTLLGFMTGALLWSVGLLSDQISKLALKSEGL